MLIKSTSSNFRLTAIILNLVALLLIGLGLTLSPTTATSTLISASGSILTSIGGSILAIAWIDIFRELSSMNSLRNEFLALGDYYEKGIKRICSSDEIIINTKEELKKTTELKVIGFTSAWLLKELLLLPLREKLTSSKFNLEILIFNPLGEELEKRYKHEDPNAEYTGKDFAKSIIKLYDKKSAQIRLFVYDVYPTTTMCIFSESLFVGPVLHGRGNDSNFTAIYKRDSPGGKMFEDHFNNLKKDSTVCQEVDQEYIDKLKAKFFNTDAASLPK